MFFSVLSHAFFWTFMLIMTVFSVLFVVLLYYPYVILKALWLAASGRLHEATGIKRASA